jgi:hypothetical protein
VGHQGITTFNHDKQPLGTLSLAAPEAYLTPLNNIESVGSALHARRGNVVPKIAHKATYAMTPPT